jgi:hypothetical protein|tara:strand:- start:43 stop:606 length:564 start_codon:yes stop_codon:yes gene_type:complete
MAVKSIYTKYFQKSKVFLYPLLGFKRGIKIVPSETYLAWDSYYIPEDMKLVCLYHPNNSNEYENYEKKVLLKHTRLCDIKNLDQHNKLFIFDFADLKGSWQYFLDGQYSKLDNKYKGEIKSFFNINSANYVYMNSYLHPESFFEDYAECLNVDIKMLKDVGELCNKPDLEKETFKVRQSLEKTEIIN